MLFSTDLQNFIAWLPYKKLYGSFLWMGFNCLKTTNPLRGAAYFPPLGPQEIPGTPLINLSR